MTHYALLLKKQLGDILPARNKRRFSLSAFLPSLLMLALSAGIIAAFVLIFSRFTNTYTAIRINRVEDIPSRQFELMTIAYFVLIVIFTVSGINRLCYSLFENSDVNVLISMPFSAFELFLSKLTGIYFRQLMLSLVFVLPVNLTFFVTTDLVNVYNVLMTIVVAVLMPILPLGIASALVLPYYLLKRFISSHYLLSFLVMTLLMVAFCVAYSFIFRFVEQLLGKPGGMATLFNEPVMNAIRRFTSFAYPANLIANIMLKRSLPKNLGILAAIIVVSAAIGFVIVRAIFIKATQKGFAPHIPHVKRRRFNLRRTPRMLSLISKEFLIVLRTPGYAYMYFTTAIIMPIMVYYSVSLGSDLLGRMTGMSVGFELCTFLVLLYSTLTNTFCSTGISRDGYMIMMQKTLPYSPAQILTAKMIFGAFVSELSVIACAIMLAVCKMESVPDALVTCLAATLLSVAQLMFATRLDLNHPHFSKTDDGEIKEANSTVSTIIVIGLVVCLVLGVLLMLGPIGAMLGDKAPIKLPKAASYVIALAIPLVLLGLAAAFFFINLKKVYSNIDAEN